MCSRPLALANQLAQVVMDSECTAREALFAVNSLRTALIGIVIDMKTEEHTCQTVDLKPSTSSHVRSKSKNSRAGTADTSGK